MFLTKDGRPKSGLRVLREPFESQFGDFAASLKRHLTTVELEAVRADRHGMRSFWMSSEHFDPLLGNLKRQEMTRKSRLRREQMCVGCNGSGVLSVRAEEKRLLVLDLIPSVDFKPDNDTTDNEIRETLKCLPDSLHNMYKRALQKIRGQPIQKRNLAWKVLMRIAHAKKQLTLHQVVEAVAIEKGIIHIGRRYTITDKSSITAVCADLVMVDQARRVQAVHSSVKEFLASEVFGPAHLAPDVTLSAGAASIKLAEACLLYLFLGNPEKGHHRIATNSLNGWNTMQLPYVFGTFRMPANVGTEEDRFRGFPKQVSPLHFVDSTETEAQLNSQDSLGRTPLLIAIQHSRDHMEDILLNRGAGCHIPNKEGFTCLHYAAQNGNVSSVDRVLLAGADVNAKSGDAKSALHEAASSGRLKVVDRLLEAGADPRAPTTDDDLLTALAFAALGGHSDIAERLLAVTLPGPGIDSSLAILCVAYYGHLPVLELLLAAGMDINKRDSYGCDVLHAALENDQVGVSRYLVAAGADMRIRNSCGWPGFHSAAVGGVVSLLELLLASGAELDVQGDAGFSSLHAAIASANDADSLQNIHHLLLQLYLNCLAIVEALLSRGADANAQDERGLAALYFAAGMGYLDILTHLLASGADILIQDDRGWTGVHWAAWNGQWDAVELLLSRGLDPNIPNHRGSTPLICASVRSIATIVSRLIAARANSNAQHSTGESFIYVVAHCGHPEVVSMLLALGADPGLPRGDGFTAIHSAAQRGHAVCVSEFIMTGKLDVNVESFEGISVLQSAAGSGHLAITREPGLKQAGRLYITRLRMEGILSSTSYPRLTLTLGVQSTFGNSALHVASSDGHNVVASKLLQPGAGTTAQKDSGRTALHSVAKSGHHVTVRQLAEAMVDINQRNSEGDTGLMLAAGFGHDAVVGELLCAAADAQLKNKKGQTALHSAAYYGHSPIVDRLPEVGVVLNVQDSYGCSAFFQAAASDRLSLVDKLLAIATGQFCTVSTGNHAAVLKLSLGATSSDPAAEDRHGWTPFHVAAFHQQEPALGTLPAGAQGQFRRERARCSECSCKARRWTDDGARGGREKEQSDSTATAKKETDAAAVAASPS
ncbi:hypothetical protein FGG08_007420 [Glutinoglossum americanum]|uniref:GPI inositol-deacylase winged helix domain-containing protein n=1 Tax=Glutinoglossum americanum TaxID=1670608 RepID=A0A9P8HZH7_9PEZI|nr:hypothetical protein FGG08_007420 [Glutinoglossum americanum]